MKKPANKAVSEAYDRWSRSYDTNENKTRDLDEIVTRTVLSKYPFNKVVELGCGTGKNSAWLLNNADEVIGLDFSPAMLDIARQKIDASNVQFFEADITQPWPVTDASADLITCNLVLEHIETLFPVFQQAYNKLLPGGIFFIVELHPYKQYNGSQAQFTTDQGVELVDVYVHHTSEYTDAAKISGYQLVELAEWFDEDKSSSKIPRLISFVFRK